jgi:hypothetical protein
LAYQLAKLALALIPLYFIYLMKLVRYVVFESWSFTPIRFVFSFLFDTVLYPVRVVYRFTTQQVSDLRETLFGRRL